MVASVQWISSKRTHVDISVAEALVYGPILTFQGPNHSICKSLSIPLNNIVFCCQFAVIAYVTATTGISYNINCNQLCEHILTCTIKYTGSLFQL